MDAPADLPKEHKKRSGSEDDDVVDSAARRDAASDVNRAIHRKALMKLDLFLLPVVTAIYFLNFLGALLSTTLLLTLPDRSNIGNARPAGLQADLGLTNTQYSIVLTVTYVPYIAAELPLTLAMKWM